MREKPVKANLSRTQAERDFAYVGGDGIGSKLSNGGEIAVGTNERDADGNQVQFIYMGKNRDSTSIRTTPEETLQLIGLLMRRLGVTEVHLSPPPPVAGLVVNAS